MSGSEAYSSLEEEVSSLYVQRLHGPWTAGDETAFKARLANDPSFAQAYGQADFSANALRSAADTPEMLRFREEAIDEWLQQLEERSSAGRA